MSGGHKRPPRHIYLLLVAMVFFWSVNFVVAKETLRLFPPVFCATLRFTFSALISVPVFLSRSSNRTREWTSRDLRLLLVLGVLGICGNQFIWMYGISLTSVSHAAIMIGLSPVTVLLLAALIGQERITTAKLFGLGIAVLGVVIIQSARESHTEATLAGDLLVAGSTFLFAIFSVYGKRETGRFDALIINTAGNAGAAILMLPITIWYFTHGGTNRANTVAWLGLVFMAVFPSLICYGIYYYALNFFPASKVSALGYLQPVLSTGLAVGLLHEPLSTAFIGGGILVLGGVLAAERA